MYNLLETGDGKRNVQCGSPRGRMGRGSPGKGGAGPFASNEAALEAAIGPAMNAIKEGHEVVLTVPWSAGDQSALGTRER